MADAGATKVARPAMVALRKPVELESPMSLAYLLNWYPQPSQTALRREVTALEEMGVSFHRLSLRRYEGELVDENDRAERARTRSVLDVGVLGFLRGNLEGGPPGAPRVHQVAKACGESGPDR